MLHDKKLSPYNRAALKVLNFYTALSIPRMLPIFMSKTNHQNLLEAYETAFRDIKSRANMRGMLCSIDNGFPEQGGSGDAPMNCAPAKTLNADTAETSDCSDSQGAPETTESGDGDDDSDGDPDSDRRRPRSKTSHPSFPPALLGLEPLSHYISFGRSRIYQLIAADEFPKPIKIGKSSRWLKAEIDAWISKQASNQQAEG